MSIGISLGHNCFSASHGVFMGIRKQKSEGYTTCPFDEMNSMYPGVVQCIQDDFKDFTNVAYLQLVTHPPDCRYYPNETLIYNTKYGFIFNHESPGHADLYSTQAWPGGSTHFIDNNFEKFIERYERRIQNFRSYVASKHPITFIITAPDGPLSELINVLDTICHGYKIHRFNIQNMDSYTYHTDLIRRVCKK
jgi:hypothetical protein